MEQMLSLIEEPPVPDILLPDEPELPKLEAALNILRHLPGKHNQKSHGGGRKGVAGKLSGLSAAAVAKDVHAKAVAAEPAITKDMQDLATANGGELVNLDFRLKTQDSLKRKIADKARDEFGGDHKAAGADIGDSVRYTMQLDEQNYASAAKATIDSLNEQGYSTNVKNYWQEGNVYKGINVTTTAPNGQIFELQFHTKDSFNLKENVNHPLYEIYRLPTTPAAQKYDLALQMSNNWKSVALPANLDLLATVGKPVLQLPTK